MNHREPCRLSANDLPNLTKLAIQLKATETPTEIHHLTMTLSDSESLNGLRPMSATAAKRGTAKFTKKTKAYKLLLQLFKDGKISPVDRPSDVRLAYPEFHEYTVTQFRSQFNQIKKTHGLTTVESKCTVCPLYCLAPISYRFG